MLLLLNLVCLKLDPSPICQLICKDGYEKYFGDWTCEYLVESDLNAFSLTRVEHCWKIEHTCLETSFGSLGGCAEYHLLDNARFLYVFIGAGALTLLIMCEVFVIANA